MTDPLVPAEVDLTDFAFMPLDVRRLRDSRFASTIDGETFKVGLLLWCASWHQKPAASLPDDDVELAQLAGFGRVVREWNKARSKGALYGWVKCSDGRLYHPIVAEKANESWRSKLEHAYQKMRDRLRKLNKERTDKKLPAIGAPSFEQWNSKGRRDDFHAADAGIPAETPTPSDGIPAETSLKGEVRDRETLEKKGRKRPPAFNAAEIDLPEWLDAEIWRRWCADRQKRGKTITEEGARAQIKRLAQYESDGVKAFDVIEHALASGNQGLFPPPLRRRGEGGGLSFRERDTAAKQAQFSAMTNNRIDPVTGEFRDFEMETRDEPLLLGGH